MLGADVFTLAALEAVGGFCGVLGVDVVVVIVAVPVVELLFCVHAGEQVGNGNALRADLGAVAAAGAGNQTLSPENRADSGNGHPLFLVQRLKILHKAAVIRHHFRA